MDIDEAKIKLAAEFTQQCLLPELERDIGDQPLEREDFNLYVYGLEKNLGLLFDIIGKNADLLFKRIPETVEFRIHFILVLNEQTGGREEPFHTQNKGLINHLQSMIRQFYCDTIRDRSVFYAVLDYYKSKLNSKNWKKCIGAVHGYNRFCEIYYGQSMSKLSGSDAMFLLSVATILTEYFEEFYKSIGVDLFLILLNCGDEQFLTKSNIYETIYSKIMNPLIQTITQEQTIVSLLNCLLKCVTHDLSWQKNPSDWNKVDDVLEVLLKRIAFEPNCNVATVLLSFIAKFIALPIIDNDFVNKSLDFESLKRRLKTGIFDHDIEQLREECNGFNNLLAYRWTKKLLQLFAHGTFFGQIADVFFALRVLHIFYLITIFPIQMKLLDSNWIDFIEKFLPVLIGVHKSNKTDAQIGKEISAMIGTFMEHIERNQDNSGSNEEMMKEIKESLAAVRSEINS